MLPTSQTPAPSCAAFTAPEDCPAEVCQWSSTGCVPQERTRTTDAACSNYDDPGYETFTSLEECLAAGKAFCMWQCRLKEFRGLPNCTIVESSCSGYIESMESLQFVSYDTLGDGYCARDSIDYEQQPYISTLGRYPLGRLDGISLPRCKKECS